MPKKVLIWSFTKFEWVCVALLELKSRPGLDEGIFESYVHLNIVVPGTSGPSGLVGPSEPPGPSGLSEPSGPLGLFIFCGPCGFLSWYKCTEHRSKVASTSVSLGISSFCYSIGTLNCTNYI